MRLLYICLCLISTPVLTAPEEYGGRYLWGMEVELHPDKVANLVRYLDLSTIAHMDPERIKSSLSYKALNSYLSDWRVFDTLPEGIQEKLLNGLKRPEVKIALPEPPSPKITFDTRAVPVQGILGPDGNPVSQGLILPESKNLDAPSKKESLAKFESEIQNYENRRVWETVLSRWNVLPYEERLNAIQVDELSDSEKAKALMENLTSQWHEAIPVPTRKDAPEEVKALLSKLKMHRDGDYLEFKHEKPVANPREYLNDIKKFGELALVSRELNYADLGNEDKATYHLNVSDPSGRNLYEIGTLYNEYLLMKLFEAGYRDLFGDNGYSPQLFRKGLLTMKEPNYMEIRAHVQSPEATVKELRELLDAPAEVASRKIADKLAEGLTPQLETFLFEKNALPLAQMVGAILHFASPHHRQAIERRLQTDRSFQRKMKYLPSFGTQLVNLGFGRLLNFQNLERLLPRQAELIANIIKQKPTTEQTAPRKMVQKILRNLDTKALDAETLFELHGNLENLVPRENRKRLDEHYLEAIHSKVRNWSKLEPAERAGLLKAYTEQTNAYKLSLRREKGDLDVTTEKLLAEHIDPRTLRELYVREPKQFWDLWKNFKELGLSSEIEAKMPAKLRTDPGGFLLSSAQRLLDEGKKQDLFNTLSGLHETEALKSFLKKASNLSSEVKTKLAEAMPKYIANQIQCPFEQVGR